MTSTTPATRRPGLSAQASPYDLPTHPTLRHPRTGLALRAIGLHPRTGAPRWPIMGASPDEPDWATTFEGKTPDQVKTELEDAKAAAEAAKSGKSPWDELFQDQKPEDVKQSLENSRKWEDRAKGNKAKADQLDELVATITGKDDGEKDPTKLTQALTAAQRDARDTKVENAVLKSAGKHEASPGRLTDSRSFMTKIADLDPAADDFTEKLDAAIKKAVEDDESLKVTASGGGTGRPPPTRQQGKPSEGKAGGSVAEIMAERRAARASKTST